MIAQVSPHGTILDVKVAIYNYFGAVSSKDISTHIIVHNGRLMSDGWYLKDFGIISGTEMDIFFSADAVPMFLLSGTRPPDYAHHQFPPVQQSDFGQGIISNSEASTWSETMKYTEYTLRRLEQGDE